MINAVSHSFSSEPSDSKRQRATSGPAQLVLRVPTDPDQKEPRKSTLLNGHSLVASHLFTSIHLGIDTSARFRLISPHPTVSATWGCLPLTFRSLPPRTDSDMENPLVAALQPVVQGLLTTRYAECKFVFPRVIQATHVLGRTTEQWLPVSLYSTIIVSHSPAMSLPILNAT